MSGGENFSPEEPEKKDFVKNFNLFLRHSIGSALAGMPFGAGDLLSQLLFTKNNQDEFRYPRERLRDIQMERDAVAHIASEVLDPVLFEPYTSPLDEADYMRLRTSVKEYYLLTAPSLNPDQYPQVLATEAKTNIAHIGRTRSGQTAWVANERSALVNHSLPITELGEMEKAEVERWFKKYDGLLDHVFVAAEPFMVALLSALQRAISKKIERDESINGPQRTLLTISPYFYGIKMLFHDDGRKISQHRVAHEHETIAVLSQAGVSEDFMREPAHPVIGAEFTKSVTKMLPTEANIMQLLFYFVDCVAKIDRQTGKLRRPEDFSNVFSGQQRRYTGISSDEDAYTIFEEITFNNILLWLQDNVRGLGFSYQDLMQVYEQVERGIDDRRNELGLVD